MLHMMSFSYGAFENNFLKEFPRTLQKFVSNKQISRIRVYTLNIAIIHLALSNHVSLWVLEKDMQSWQVR